MYNIKDIINKRKIMRKLKARKVISGLLYFLFLILGIHAAYTDRLAVALFFAITWASENIAISIDYWPLMQKKTYLYEILKRHHK